MSEVTVSSSHKTQAISWQMCAALIIAAAVMMLPDLAHATSTTNDTPIGNIFCLVKGWFVGNTGKGIATIAVTIIGIGALLGKVSWGMALIVGLGIALVFGAAGVIDAVGTGANIPGYVAGCNTSATWR